ncbi:hypothetical protein REPUB_Repub12eG0130000 [Reevesia pubescens]
MYRSYLSRFSSPKNFLPIMVQSLNPHFLVYPPHVFSDNPVYNIPIYWHLGHSHGHHDHHHNVTKEGEKLFWLGLGADICLATGKALTGYLSGSTAIIADATHSISDVVLSGVALWSFIAANAPKDKEHPYGRGKFETLGALGISCMFLASACGIAWHALDLLIGLLSTAPVVNNHSLAHGHNHHHGIDLDHPMLALSMTIIAISVKEGLYWIIKRAGERQGSGLMKANAWHHHADATSSVVALIGVVQEAADIDKAVTIAWLIISFPAEQLERINQTILQVEGVKGCHPLRGRRAGSNLYLDVHIVKFVVEGITHHMLQGKILVEVEISMPPGIMIRYKLLISSFDLLWFVQHIPYSSASNIVHVIVQLRLGRPIPEFK